MKQNIKEYYIYSASLNRIFILDWCNDFNILVYDHKKRKYHLSLSKPLSKSKQLVILK